MALETGRVVDVVKQTDEAPHGGEGWVGRDARYLAQHITAA